VTAAPPIEPIEVMRWRMNKSHDWPKRWHVPATGDRHLTRCRLLVPHGANRQLRVATASFWPRICAGCREDLLRGRAHA